MKLTKTFINYTVIAITSESGSFFKENLNRLESFKREWRSTGTSAQDIDIDLGAIMTDPVIHFDRLNANVSVLGGDDGITFAGYNSGELTPLIDPRQRVYRMRQVLTGFSHRYLRVHIAGAQTTKDGESFYRIGSMPIIGSAALVALANNPQFGTRHRTPNNRGELIQEKPAGGAHTLSFSTIRPFSFTLEFSRDKRKADTATLWEMFSNANDTVFVDFGMESWRAYLCKPITTMGDAWSSIYTEDFDTIELQVNG